MALVNETIGFLAVGVIATTLLFGTVVSVKKAETPEVSVKDDRKYPPVPIKKPVAAPQVSTPALPPPVRVEAISEEIMKEDPSLSKEEVIDAVDKAERLDHIEQRIDEVVVEQRKLSDRIETYISKQGPEK